MNLDHLSNIVEERQKELTLCRDWTVANSGGFEGTIDIWDISTLPADAYFDVRFDMINIPDRILVYYPDTDMKYDSGWRGSPQASSVLTSNQLSGSGVDTVLGIFQKESLNHFRIEVIGSESSTQWNYSVRCRASNDTN
jgi:hypothetical protein